MAGSAPTVSRSSVRSAPTRIGALLVASGLGALRVGRDATAGVVDQLSR